ncbi:MAG: IS200/IS605 family transposase [Geminicoccaceae bacterium]|nr:IS200/IS605 family transposase [Geminicoccaceae bacterium]
MKIQRPEKGYTTDHSIVYSCQYHVIWCPKYRRPVLVNGVDMRLKELILEKQDEYGYRIIEMEVMPDHVHLLIDSDPRFATNSVVGKIKGYTSNRLRKEFPWLRKRLPTLWTRSKFISTVGAVTLEVVQQYIEDQKNV